MFLLFACLTLHFSILGSSKSVSKFELLFELLYSEIITCSCEPQVCCRIAEILSC